MLKTTSSVAIAGIVATLCAAAGTIGSAATGQESTSRPMVAKLTTTLVDAKLQSVAAEDPARPGYMVAVLYIPGVQLLMIAGQCDAIDTLRARLAANAYRDVYTDLHACSNPGSRLFIQDMSADGLGREPARDGAPFDIVYEHMTRQTRFDGDFKGQDLSAEEYNRRFTTIDAEYARLLSVLFQHVSGESSARPRERPSAPAVDRVLAREVQTYWP